MATADTCPLYSVKDYVHLSLSLSELSLLYTCSSVNFIRACILHICVDIYIYKSVWLSKLETVDFVRVLPLFRFVCSRIGICPCPLISPVFECLQKRWKMRKKLISLFLVALLSLVQCFKVWNEFSKVYWLMTMFCSSCAVDRTSECNLSLSLIRLLFQ